MIPGVFLLEPMTHTDERGSLTKMVSSEFAHWKEAFYSWSDPGVLRGLHFQIPPYSQDKIVFCLHGHVMDITLDLRVGSPMYGQCQRIPLDEHQGIYIPKGIAHGFYVPLHRSLLVYLTTSVHSHEHDKGVQCPGTETMTPIMSDRDKAFPTVAEFKSPFRFT